MPDRRIESCFKDDGRGGCANAVRCGESCVWNVVQQGVRREGDLYLPEAYWEIGPAGIRNSREEIQAIVNAAAGRLGERLDRVEEEYPPATAGYLARTSLDS